MRDRRLAVVVIGILIAACNPTPPAASLAPGASAEESRECPAIDIRGPSGTPVDLTGVWRSNDLGIYDLHQIGSCLHWLGMSQYLGEEPGSSWTNVFAGTVQSDLTIVGRWADVPFNPEAIDNLGHGTMPCGSGSSTPAARNALRCESPA